MSTRHVLFPKYVHRKVKSIRSDLSWRDIPEIHLREMHCLLDKLDKRALLELRLYRENAKKRGKGMTYDVVKKRLQTGHYE